MQINEITKALSNIKVNNYKVVLKRNGDFMNITLPPDFYESGAASARMPSAFMLMGKVAEELLKMERAGHDIRCSTFFIGTDGKQHPSLNASVRIPTTPRTSTTERTVASYEDRVVALVGEHPEFLEIWQSMADKPAALVYAAMQSRLSSTTAQVETADPETTETTESTPEGF